MQDKSSATQRLLLGLVSTALTYGAFAALVPVAAMAQDSASNDAIEEVVVTGYRKSLQNSTDAKRESVSFTDKIFAEDIGKFPDTNIAESFNRIPGITITRETSGEGLNIAIRGLGTNFTRILLNGAPVAVASTGRTDSQNTNREVDLDMFPTELFTQLTVNKSSMADMTEGGAAGTVDMRSARPFDNPGLRIAYSGQGTKNSEADDWGARGSLLASNTWDKFGVLVGVAGVTNKVRTTGFETIGWTNANLSATQSTSATRNNTGGGNWTIPATVPANAGNGLTTGATIDQAFLLANNPGASITQIDNGIIPRLGRPSDEFGDKDRYNGIVSLEFRPSDELHFYLDSMYGKRKNDMQRIDMNWVGRNGAAVPLNMTFDRADCTNGCVVTGGTFANAQFFLEYRPFIEDADFWGVNPGFEWQIGDRMKFDLQGNYTESSFHRESPTVLVNTPGSSGVTVNFTNDGTIPTMDSVVDLNDPANFVWPGGRVNIQDEKRDTDTKGVRGNFTWGDNGFNVRFGAAYDEVSRTIVAIDNSQFWQNAVCGNAPNVEVPGPNSQPGCNGLVAPGAAPAGFPTYPGLGTGYSTGSPALNYSGSLIPQTSLGSYLMPGPDGFVTVDWNRLRADSNYAAFHAAAPETGASNTGASAGFVEEKVTGGYVELNGATDLGGNSLRYNVGVRFVSTDQDIGGRVTFPDNRNITATTPAITPAAPCYTSATNGTSADGGCYPNAVNVPHTTNTYDNWLPSMNLAYGIGEHAIVRGALSRTMTRPNPNSMLPGLNFSTPSADVATVGNPALDPFISDNIDLGFEYYTGSEGYFGFAAFRKSIEGFTVNGSSTVPFSALEVYGITYNTLTTAQQTAIDARGGPTVATVVLTQQVNASGNLTVNGLEFNWVQPLDFLLGRVGLNGLGFTANMTLIDQVGKGAAPAIAVGVAPSTYNFTLYYENYGVSARVSRTYADGAVTSTPNQNGITAASLFSNNYGQWDFSSSFDFGKMFGANSTWYPELTIDVVNFTNEDQRGYFQFNNAAFTQYTPGRQILVGLRGTFK
ncbi:MAG TPA: TonB-dependent receptor [Steroidobacteraceae bacterium]|nr:TonB-dependent receptor [Steroidobacteraceae bacterium]